MFKFMKLIKLHSNIKYKIIAVLICCILLILVCLFQQSQNNIISGQIKRPEPGEEDLSTQINVLDSSGKVITTMDLTIKPRTLTETEVFEYFDRAYDEIIKVMCGNNKGLECVRENLVFPDMAQNGIISLDWYTSDYQLVNYDGTVNNRGFERDESREVTIMPVMEYGDYRRECEILITVLAPDYDSGTWTRIQAQNEVNSAIDSSGELSDINLPKIIGGNKVSYEEDNDNISPFIIICMGAVIIFLLVFIERDKEKKRIITRQRELTYDYSEVISKLTLLLGAGMTTRMAWHKISDDYNIKRQEGAVKKRCVYEEMCETDCNMQAGISEAMAYEQFGKRCNTREYMKLASLLQTNIKKGTRELRRLLENEAYDAFEKRKNMAKIKGEEATTRLLMPMLLMLVIVMAVIMVPAVTSFNM